MRFLPLCVGSSPWGSRVCCVVADARVLVDRASDASSTESLRKEDIVIVECDKDEDDADADK